MPPAMFHHVTAMEVDLDVSPVILRTWRFTRRSTGARQHPDATTLIRHGESTHRVLLTQGIRNMNWPYSLPFAWQHPQAEGARL